MSTKFRVCTLVLWIGSAFNAGAHFPFLHVYLNTPNCYGHSAGVMMLDSIDTRCARAIFIAERGQGIREELASTLGLRPNSIAVHTLPTDQFNRQLWQGGFSRFVYGMGKDTIYDTNLDYLFQYADSINHRIQLAGPQPLIRIEGGLRTSGSVSSSIDGAGDLLLFDEFLGRVTRCVIHPDKGSMTCSSLQLPAGKDLGDLDLGTSTIFKRETRFSALCQQLSKGETLTLFASVRTGYDAEGYAQEEPRLIMMPANAAPSSHAFTPLKGYMVSNDGGSLLNDTLFMRTYRTSDSSYAPGFGLFILRGETFMQLTPPRKAASFPTAISQKLEGNFSDGFFSGNWFFYRNMPLAYDARSGTYHDLGGFTGVPLDTVVEHLSNYRFGDYYCSDALVEGDVVALLVNRDKALQHVTLDLKTREKLSTGEVQLPSGYYLALKLLDREQAFYVSDDQLHAWVIPLE